MDGMNVEQIRTVIDEFILKKNTAERILACAFYEFDRASMIARERISQVYGNGSDLKVATIKLFGFVAQKSYDPLEIQWTSKEYNLTIAELCDYVDEYLIKKLNAQRAFDTSIYELQITYANANDRLRDLYPNSNDLKAAKIRMFGADLDASLVQEKKRRSRRRGRRCGRAAAWKNHHQGGNNNNGRK